MNARDIPPAVYQVLDVLVCVLGEGVTYPGQGGGLLTLDRGIPTLDGGYPPSKESRYTPPQIGWKVGIPLGVNRLKILPSVILRMRPVTNYVASKRKRTKELK